LNGQQDFLAISRPQAPTSRTSRSRSRTPSSVCRAVRSRRSRQPARLRSTLMPKKMTKNDERDFGNEKKRMICGDAYEPGAKPNARPVRMPLAARSQPRLP
jgi:hypothetical protein